MAQHTPVQRFTRWAIASAVCTGVQFSTTWGLGHVTNTFWAGAIGYLVSGQLSFVLNSTFTWADRHPELPSASWQLTRLICWRWLKYFAVNFTMAVFNGLIQWQLAKHVIRLLAFVVAGLICTPCNVTLLDKLVFRHDDPPTELVERS